MHQVRLLLAGFGYQIMHTQRAVLERVTGTGWSLRRLAERVLRTPARFTVSGRRVTMIPGGAAAHWLMLARGSRPCTDPPDRLAEPPHRPAPGPCGPHGAEVSPDAGYRLCAAAKSRLPNPTNPSRRAPQNPLGLTTHLAESRATPQFAFNLPIHE